MSKDSSLLGNCRLLIELQDIGIHWGVAVPGFIALACLPFPVLFYLYGAKIRARCKYAALAEQHLRKSKEGANMSSQPSTDLEENAITKI